MVKSALGPWIRRQGFVTDRSRVWARASGGRTVRVAVLLHHAAPLLSVGVSMVLPLPDDGVEGVRAVRRAMHPVMLEPTEVGVRVGTVTPGYFESPAVSQLWWADVSGREREVGWEMVSYLEEKALPWVETVHTFGDLVAWRGSVDVSLDRVLRRRG